MFNVKLSKFPSALCIIVFTSLAGYIHASETHSKTITRIDLLKDAAAKITDFRAFANARYSQEGTEIYQTLHALSDKFLVLLVDPGVSIRADEFAGYVLAHNLKTEDPWQARKKFSDHLGTMTLYRGMNLSDAQIETIKKTGILARSMRSDVSAAKVLRRSLATQVNVRLENKIDSSDALVSLTKDIGLAWYFSNAVDPNLPYASKQHGVIYQIEIPVIDVFSQYSSIIQSHRKEYTSVAWENPDDGNEILVFLQVDSKEARPIWNMPISEAQEKSPLIIERVMANQSLMRDKDAFLNLLYSIYPNMR